MISDISRCIREYHDAMAERARAEWLHQIHDQQSVEQPTICYIHHVFGEATCVDGSIYKQAILLVRASMIYPINHGAEFAGPVGSVGRRHAWAEEYKASAPKWRVFHKSVSWGTSYSRTDNVGSCVCVGPGRLWSVQSNASLTHTGGLQGGFCRCISHGSSDNPWASISVGL